MSWKKWSGDKLIRDTHKAVGKGLEDTANIIGEVSDSQVPHDEGTLQRSKFITQDPQSEMFGPQAWIISYGGGPGTGYPRVPYARKWHENPASFQKGRKSKYLRDPLFQVGPNALMKSITQRMRRAWT